ncbi:MAG: HD domain-containing protein, partial [Abitibacteriaceae bacterium]|nr:HD domain-containing protein [Abditibacteriaceae bacterium]
LADELCLRISNHLRIRFQQVALQEKAECFEQLVQERTQELETYQLELKEAHLEMINRLARAAEHHDDETGQHTQRVAVHCALLGQALNLSEERINLLRQAAALHDVGKIGIPDSVLLKPGRFTEAEYKIMQQHTIIGADLLAGGHSDLLRMAELIALTHHEKWDGSGYPRGLRRDGIDVFGRILALADVFDALTHERPYKRAWSVEETIEEIKQQSGKHFDPTIVEAFLSLPHDELL